MYPMHWLIVAVLVEHVACLVFREKIYFVFINLKAQSGLNGKIREFYIPILGRNWILSFFLILKT